jgi:hypothetical protein
MCPTINKRSKVKLKEIYNQQRMKTKMEAHRKYGNRPNPSYKWKKRNKIVPAGYTYTMKKPET